MEVYAYEDKVVIFWEHWIVGIDTEEYEIEGKEYFPVINKISRGKYGNNLINDIYLDDARSSKFRWKFERCELGMAPIYFWLEPAINYDYLYGLRYGDSTNAKVYKSHDLLVLYGDNGKIYRRQSYDINKYKDLLIRYCND